MLRMRRFVDVAVVVAVVVVVIAAADAVVAVATAALAVTHRQSLSICRRQITDRLQHISVATVAVAFTLKRSFYPTTPAVHPVSILIIHP